MTTIYDAAIRNFCAAADMLEALQAARFDLVNEACNGLTGRPRLNLGGGYNDVTEVFGVCLPSNARANILRTENDGKVELRISNADWITLEGTISTAAAAEGCYLEIRGLFGSPFVADLFLREFIGDGSARDSGHRELHVASGSVGICKLVLPELQKDITNRRVVLHIRHPAQRLVIDQLVITLV